MCAEIYHRLYKLIDHKKPIFFCADGMTAGEPLPDLCFFFKKGNKEFRIEAKVLSIDRRIRISKNQRGKWRIDSNYRKKPHYWIGYMENVPGEKRYVVWPHTFFENKLQKCYNSSGPLVVFEKGKEQLLTINDVLKKIISFAQSNRFLSIANK